MMPDESQGGETRLLLQQKDIDVYQKFSDPWGQSGKFASQSLSRALLVHWVRRLTDDSSDAHLVLDVGCGLGQLTQQFAREGAECVGLDSSETAIQLAESLNKPGLSFFYEPSFGVGTLRRWQPSVVVISEVLWYVLDDLDSWLDAFRSFASESRAPLQIVLSQTFYPPGEQKFGLDKFSDTSSLVDYLGFEVIESAEVLEEVGAERKAMRTCLQLRANP